MSKNCFCEQCVNKPSLVQITSIQCYKIVALQNLAIRLLDRNFRTKIAHDKMDEPELSKHIIRNKDRNSTRDVGGRGSRMLDLSDVKAKNENAHCST